MKQHQKQSRWICMIGAVMITCLFFGAIVFASVITGIPRGDVRDFICFCYILFSFYYACRNINKLLYE